MPKQFLELPAFLGVDGTSDPRDLSPGVGAYAYGLDPSVRRGLWRGMPQLEEELGAGLVGEGFTLFQDGTQVIYYDTVAGRVKRLHSLPDAAAIDDTLGAATGTVGGGVSDGNSVRLAMGQGNNPQYVGYIGSSPTYQLESANLETPASPWNISNFAWAGTPDQDSNPFEADVAYLWAISLVYDGKQESCLAKDLLAAQTNAQSQEKATFDITRETGATRSDRITGVKIYRAQAGVHRDLLLESEQTFLETDEQGNIVTYPGRKTRAVFSGSVDMDTVGQYTLVAFIDMDDAGWSADVFSYTDDFKVGPSYERTTGLPQTLPHMDMSYDLIIRVGSYAVIAGVDVQGEDDPESGFMVMRSKTDRFDMYNWVEDFYTIETGPPTAMVEFQGRIWIFESARLHMMALDLGEPLTMDGIGCVSRKSVISTEIGMFFAGPDNIYFHDGTHLRPVGDPVRNLIDNFPLGVDVGYENRDTTVDPVVFYDPKHSVFGVIYENAVYGTNTILLYSPKYDRWCPFTGPTEHGGSPEVIYEAFTAGGISMLAAGGKLYKLFRGSTRAAWGFISHDLIADLAPQIFYEALLTSAPTTFLILEDGGAWTSVSFALGADGNYRGVINTSPANPPATEAWKSVTRLKFRMDYAAGKNTRFVGLTRRILHVT